MTSSVDTRRQHADDAEKPSISAERLDSASIPGSLARLQSNQQSETPVLSDTQMQSTSQIEVKSTDGGGKEVEGQQEKEGQETLRQIKKDLEDITGFGSYEDYVRSFERDPMHIGRSYVEILNAFTRSANNHHSGVDIIDVSNEDISPVGVSLRCEKLSAGEISGALCHPPPNTRAQVVIWPIDSHPRGIEDFLDVLGLGLQLDPWFFEAFRWREDENGLVERFRPKNVLCIGPLGTSVFVAPRYVLAQENPVPVVLIAGPMHDPIVYFGYESLLHKSNLHKAIYDLVQAAPLYGHYNCDGMPHLANAYIRVLFSLLKSGEDSALNSSDALSACIIPLLQIEIAICREDLCYLRRYFHELTYSEYNEFLKTRYRGRSDGRRHGQLPSGETPENLYCHRTKLRSWIEYFRNKNGALMGLLSSLLGANVRNGLFYSQIKEESISIAEEASQLEAEIRDHLQLQGSRLALLESKRSIELSNSQIYEGKRVKIFTVLAFFYIPLNLATSVFGMNIQQLNRSGTSIGVFLATAGILLFVTGVSWLVLKRVQDAQAWLRRVVEDRSSVASQDCNIFARLYMLRWFCRIGQFNWTIRTRAGWCLLMNSSSDFKPFGPRSGTGTGTAFEFVLEIMREFHEMSLVTDTD